ncbi:MFS transporter [Corynebacterium sphenisci]|uniref:MFS transporter n=1 Tax=Corynebacterium sphenisci TaxID=191493 RepID=UPI000952F80A|nr:MFS transporter [Corynebacterium sphenisci]
MRSWFLRLTAVSVVAQAVFNGGRVLLSYRVLEQGGDARTIGWFTAVFSLVPLLVALPAGRRVDGGRAPGVLRAGLIATAAAPLLMALSPTLWPLLAGYALMGFAHMLTLVAAQGMVAGLRGGARGLDSAFAQFTLGISVGQLVGIVFSGWIAARGGGSPDAVATTPALLALTVLGVLALLGGWATAGRYRVIAAGARDAAGAPAAAGPQAHEGAWRILRHRGMAPAMFASVSVIVAIDLLTAYMPVLGRELGLSVGAVTVVLAARSGMAVVSRALMPWILRRARRDLVLVPAVFAGATALAAMPWLGGVGPLAVATAVCGFAWGLVMPMTMTWVSQLAGPADRATALSVRLMGNRLAQVALPPLAGLGAAAMGAGSVFLSAGVLMGLAGAGAAAASRSGTLDRG